MARLERAWVEAYHAADAEPLMGLVHDETAQLKLHPAARLVRSPFAILAIWEANQPGREPRPLELGDEGENVLVTRSAAEVQASRIPDEAAAVIEAVAVGETVGPSEHLERLRIGRHVGRGLAARMILQGLLDRLRAIASFLAPPFLRIALAVPFFRSGLTKWDAPGVLSSGAAFLFSDEFRLHIFGQAVPFPAPLLFAYIDGVLEIVLPLLLVVGMATRLSAVGLLAMTGVIELVVPDAWATFHLPWAAMALALIALGAGPLSLDRLVARRFGATRPEPVR